ncbi:interferon lambda-3-like [Marmota monax]|uniref:interferon lambda-3-like n=1 Tax=Marmota monax TaxID=9995 RepID=UPI001EB01779|nr:interferon lambda-3-like [Marmota monax]
MRRSPRPAQQPVIPFQRLRAKSTGTSLGRKAEAWLLGALRGTSEEAASGDALQGRLPGPAPGFPGPRLPVPAVWARFLQRRRGVPSWPDARELGEEPLLLKDLECRSPLLPRPWDLRQLQVWERPVALQAELALTLRVLGTMATSTLGDVLDQPLHTLGHIQSQLQACVSPGPTAGPRPQGRHRHRLSHWLQRLQQAPEKESPVCLEASVTFNLLRLLVRDLKCVASGHLCV